MNMESLSLVDNDAPLSLEDLWKLRCWARAGFQDGPASSTSLCIPLLDANIIDALREAREKCVALIAVARNDDSFNRKMLYSEQCEIFLCVWNLFSRVKRDHRLHVPPLFRGQKELDSVIRRAVADCTMRELGISAQNSGHLILGGVEGAGKTTLLKAFAIASAVLFDILLPVYWSYETTTLSSRDGGNETGSMQDSLSPLKQTLPLPAELVEEMLRPADQHQTSQSTEVVQVDHKNLSPKEAVQRLNERGFRLFLLVDEFQRIYARDALINHRRLLASQMCEIARSPNTYCMLAGSSANMRRYVFRYQGDATDEWHDFPNFNGSLYVFVDVPVLRTLAILKEYVVTRYGSCSFAETDDDISQLLFHTGGVGRWIHDAWKRGETRIFPDRRAKPLETFQQDKDFRSLVALLVSFNEDAIKKHRGLDTLPAIGIEYNSVIAMLGPICDNIVGQLRRWADQGLIYLEADDSGPKSVQLLVPRDCYLYVGGERAVEDLLLFAMCSLMICQDYEINAGKPLEKLIRPRIHVHFLVQQVVYRRRSLRFVPNADGIAVARVSAEQSDQWDVAADLDSLNLEHLRWEGETGLDGIVLEKTVNTRKNVPQWHIHGWQCKGGRATLQIGGGAIETYENHYKTYSSVCSIKDDMLGGILAKAEVGFLRLADKLQQAFPKAEFLCRSLTITTTKDGHLAQAALNRMNEVFPLNISLAKVESLKVSQLKKNQPVSVRILDGLQWLSPCLPESLRTYAQSDEFLLSSPIHRIIGTSTSAGPKNKGKCSVQ
eukprot:ANDGO_01274.mRNA.1 hypothetical protein